ncbi:uncharacterized protein L969DRAFT_14405 [Mixia osmundae IAM 14324]|uniref:DUF676 domain-containing protein n=1 Tax=Mixia osmundae (strain CBS 9802 / IAM 14324 / JCM 22182 / KY 12970) TaxID=764103 RepID=G7E048_MIXOS|nr:uncharacterized protein L969DRAFT_14405 [Mixia osmundae IAM 14324]KEI42200.1 hypothetical protein L969DRAFT_14405 [Mixia osmundae IAM 14324]GAA96208.1 hypothetical protein E5Q_02872 [Mixia osmundae IAM 14324]
MAVQPLLIILVYIHGFKGNDNTFEGFPARINSILSEQYASRGTIVESLVYPAYQTRGELGAACLLFLEWLHAQVAEKELQHAPALSAKAKGKAKEDPITLDDDAASPPDPTLGDRPKASVVLCGHSMGGLVAADSMLKVVDDYKAAGTPPWPDILGVIAYDTPYLGLHPGTFANTATEYASYATQAHSVLTTLGLGWGALQGLRGTGSSGSKSAPANTRAPSPAASTSMTNSTTAETEEDKKRSYGWAGAAIGAAAVATAGGVAWYQRQSIVEGSTWATSWVTDHLEFVGALWKPEPLRARLDQIAAVQKDGVFFHCYYTQLPTTSTGTKRTFINLPPSTSPVYDHFTPNLNTKVKTEVDAHITMFNQKNDGSWQLGQESVALLTDWVDRRTRSRQI